METLFGKFLQNVPPPPSKAYCNYFSTEVKQRYIFPQYIHTPLHFHPLFLSGWIWTRLDSVYLSHSHSTPPPFSGGPAPEEEWGGQRFYFICFPSPRFRAAGAGGGGIRPAHKNSSLHVWPAWVAGVRTGECV